MSALLAVVALNDAQSGWCFESWLNARVAHWVRFSQLTARPRKGHSACGKDERLGGGAKVE